MPVPLDLAWCLSRSYLTLSSFRPSLREPESSKQQENWITASGNDGRETPTYSVKLLCLDTRAPRKTSVSSAVMDIGVSLDFPKAR